MVKARVRGVVAGLIAVVALAGQSAGTPAGAAPPMPTGSGQSLPDQAIVVIGRGVVEAAPDRAIVTVGAQFTRPTAQEAQERTSTVMTQVLRQVTGLGIPREEQDRIFDKFYRLDPDMTHGVGGTGLGLYICRGLVEDMKGRIWVESEPGKGSTFYFTLPVRVEAQADHHREQAHPRG